MAIWLHWSRHKLRAFINLFFALNEHEFKVHAIHASPRKHFWHGAQIALSIFSGEAVRTKTVTALLLLCASVRYNPVVLLSGLYICQSIVTGFSEPPTPHPSSPQHPEKAAPSSSKENRINIKKTEGLIRTDIWYYRICLSIYELGDKWYRSQEAITVLWGRS